MLLLRKHTWKKWSALIAVALCLQLGCVGLGLMNERASGAVDLPYPSHAAVWFVQSESYLPEATNVVDQSAVSQIDERKHFWRCYVRIGLCRTILHIRSHYIEPTRVSVTRPLLTYLSPPFNLNSTLGTIQTDFGLIVICESLGFPFAFITLSRRYESTDWINRDSKRSIQTANQLAKVVNIDDPTTTPGSVVVGVSWPAFCVSLVFHTLFSMIVLRFYKCLRRGFTSHFGKNLCPSCRYPLANLPRCPECGTPNPLAATAAINATVSPATPSSPPSTTAPPT